MQLLRFKSSLSIALISFVMGVTLSLYLLTGCNGTAPLVTSTQQISKASDSIKNYYRPQIEVLQKENEGLIARLKTVDQKLPAAKKEVKQREEKIKRLLQPSGFPARQLLKRQQSAKDTVKTFFDSPCDTLLSEVAQYIDDNHRKDSLYEIKINIQDSLLTLKDEVIEIQSKYLVSQDSLLKRTTSAQHILEKENQSLRKKIKRRKLGSRLVTIGIAIASIFTTHYISNHP